MAYTSGLMVDNTKDVGKITSSMGRDFTTGLMGGCLMDSMWTTKNKELECTHGLTVGPTTVSGTMESNTARGDSLTQKADQKWDIGKRESALGGVMIWKQQLRTAMLVIWRG